MLKFILIVLLPISLFAFDKQKAWNEMNDRRNSEIGKPHTYLLSYNFCNSEWLRYCLETLTNTPTFEYVDNYKEYSRENYPLTFKWDKTKNTIWRIVDFNHAFNTFGLLKPEDKVILFVRDFYEYKKLDMILNHRKLLNRKEHPYEQNIELTFNFIKNYIYVENEVLMENPKEVLAQVLEFLEESDTHLEEFVSQNSILLDY